MTRKYGYGIYFKRIHIDIEKTIHKELSNYDLTKSQLDVLRYLSKTKDTMICQKDLQTFLHVSNATINGLVNRLEQKGYLQRIPMKEDKRMVGLLPTEKADQLSTQIYSVIQNLEKRMVKNLSPSQQDQLYVLLEQVIENIETEESLC